MSKVPRKVPATTTTVVAFKADGDLITRFERELSAVEQAAGGVRVNRSEFGRRLFEEALTVRERARKGKAA